MRNPFKKRQNTFMKLIHDQAALTLAGLDALKAYMEGQNGPAAAELIRCEKEADEVRRILIYELNKTFITPFDREDIFALSRTIDDVLDYAYSTLNEMEVLKVRPTPFMVAHCLPAAGCRLRAAAGGRPPAGSSRRGQ